MSIFINGIEQGSGAVNYDNDITPPETPNGINLIFTVSNNPNPTTSLKLFRNGQLMKQGEDYSLSGNTITFYIGSVPESGDRLTAFYTY